MNATNIFAALTHYTLIRASGADARSFLQAQLTADLRELTPAASQLAAWCNAKGRVQVIFRVFQRGEDIYLRLPADLVALTLPRLKMFVLRSKVALEVAGDWSALGVAGSVLGARNPEKIDGAVQEPELTVIRLPGDPVRHEVWGPQDSISALGGELAKTGLRRSSVSDWRLLDLRAGLPEIHPETREAFTPHMLNLDALGAVSFRKGCYPGQEVVAKTHHRGLAKRRLFLASCDGGVAPLPATRVLTADGQHAGDVVEALVTAEGDCLVSAVLMLEHAQQAGLHLADSQRALTIRPPPYSIS